MTDSRRSSHDENKDERRYVELLMEVKTDHTGLKREIAAMNEKRRARKEKAKYLLQEIDMLKETLTSLRKNKEVSIRRLKSELQRLQEVKQKSLNDDTKEQPRMEMRRTTRASVSCVPVYDNKVYRTPKNERARNIDYDEYIPRSVKTAHIPRRRRSSSQGNRRRIRSPRVEAQISKEKIEAAAHAFLDIFCQLKPNSLKSLWEKSPQIEVIDNEKVLSTKRIGSFLHGLVVFAFRHDNPEHPAPSVRRTRPLVSVLKLRLTPYIEDEKYLNMGHFTMFPVWLEKPEKAEQEINLRSSDKATDDIERRRQLKVGSECQIWSDGGQKWCEGQVKKIKFDKQGEWLLVRYNDGSTDKEVQRFSKLLKVPKRIVSDTM